MFGEIETESAPAGADIEHALARFDQELRREMPLLGELRVVEALIGALEIGAAILPVGIQKQRVEPGVEVVMMRDILARAAAIVELVDPAAAVTQHGLRARKIRDRGMRLLRHQKREQIRDGAGCQHEVAAHIGFAQPQFRVEKHARERAAADESHDDRSSRAVPEFQWFAVADHHMQVAGADEPCQSNLKQPFHRPPPFMTMPSFRAAITSASVRLDQSLAAPAMR